MTPTKCDDNFIKQYRRLIRQLLSKAGVGEFDLDDFETLVYERLLRSWSYDPDRGPFNTWLGWVIRSVVSNERKRVSRSEDALDHAVDLEVAANVIGAEDAGEAKDELARIINAAGLVPRDEAILRDIHLKGFTYEETAERHGMTLEAVKKVASRTMQALREQAAG